MTKKLTLNLKFEKGFKIGSTTLTFVVDVYNLFNQKNVQMAYGFNPWTGQPYKYGDVERPLSNYYDYYTMLSLMDPRQFDTGRNTKLGLRLDF